MGGVEVSGKRVVLAGNFSGLSQAEVKKNLTALGATVTSSVSSKTDMLFVGGKGGAKQAKAEALGIPIHEEATLLALFAPKEPAAKKTSTTKAATKSIPEEIPVEASKKSEFAGLTIAITGAFATMKRKDAQVILSKAGAKVGSSVTKKTDLLIHGKNAGSKLTKAKNLGVKIMTELEFVEVMNRSSVKSDLLDGASDKLTKAAKADEKRMRPVQKILDRIQKPQVEKWGLNLGQLLLKYFHVFAQRPDITSYEQKIGAPLQSGLQLHYHSILPAEWLALASEVNGLEFNWVFKAAAGERSNWSKGYNGGRICLKILRGAGYYFWYDIPEWRKEHESFESETTFDDFVAEGLTTYSYDKGESGAQATLFFDNANDCVRHPLGSLEDYITEGAKAAFSWYWQVTDWEGEGFRATLHADSIPVSTPPATITKLLESKGLTTEEAHAVQKWLGKDVVILLHLSETPEGKNLSKLAEIFPGLNGPSERNMDHESIASLTQASKAMTQKEWAAVLGAHQAFIASGGAGGSWQSLAVTGLPMCIYQGAEGTEGEQAVFRFKKIKNKSAAKEKLSFSDWSGSRVEDVDFTGADLSNSMLIDAIMDGCTFEGASLQHADFSGTSLRDTSFKGADLTGADFEATDLTGADFTGAKLDDSKFPGAIVENVTPSK